MKILIFNWRDIKNPAKGGAEVFTHENAKRWVAKNHEVTMLTSSFPNCKQQEIIDGVKIIRVGKKYSVYKKTKQYYKKNQSKHNFDIIIDEINTRPFLTPKYVNNGTQIVGLIHQLAREFWFYETFFPVNYIGYHILENRWLKNYEDLPMITVSNSTKNDLKKLGFKKIYTVSEGITFKPMDTVPEKQKEPTIIYLGRLTSAKRPEHVIKAFNIVKKQIPNLKLNILGDGPEKEKLQKTAGKDITFLNYVSENKKIELLSKAWILIHPGVREGWGINIIEANACGTPSIAYDVSGLRDSIVDGKTGIIIKEEGNIEKLAEEITQLIKNKERRKKLSNNALKWSKKFTWDKSADEFLEILEKINQ